MTVIDNRYLFHVHRLGSSSMYLQRCGSLKDVFHDQLLLSLWVGLPRKSTQSNSSMNRPIPSRACWLTCQRTEAASNAYAAYPESSGIFKIKSNLAFLMSYSKVFCACGPPFCLHFIYAAFVHCLAQVSLSNDWQDHSLSLFGFKQSPHICFVRPFTWQLCAANGRLPGKHWRRD